MAESSSAGKNMLPPLPRWPIATLVPSDGQDREPPPSGPVVTFTIQIPFPLGFADNSGIAIEAFGSWADSKAASVFGEKPFVAMRFSNIPIPAPKPYSERGNEVLKEHFGFILEEKEPEDNEDSHSGDAYEQWVSLETPNVRLEGEEPHDELFAFHRCLEVLSDFLRVHYFTYNDTRVRPIDIKDIGAVAYMGAYKPQGDTMVWQFLRPMFLAFRSAWNYPADRDISSDGREITAYYSQLRDNPFFISKEWHRRAVYARQYTGDTVDAVVGLQTSMESMLYATWRMLLVDQGKSSVQISNTVTADSPYRPLLVRHLSQLLGGRWDTDAVDTTVGKYWHRLYLLRNRTVHGGYRPSWADGEAAYEAYNEMRDFVNERLWQRYRTYPRTLFAKLGGEGLRRRGWNTVWMEEFMDRVESEPGPFYVPHDQRGSQEES